MPITQSQLRQIIKEELENILDEDWAGDPKIKQLDKYGKEEMPMSKLKSLRSKTTKQQEKYKKAHKGKTSKSLTKKLRRLIFALRARQKDRFGKVDK